MALCTICKGIPTHFFGPLPPNFFSPSDRKFIYSHHTPSALRHSAARGCPMCKILACQLNDDWLPQEIKDKNRLTMKRAIIDPEQAFGLWMGQDDVSHNCFYLMPPNYQQALPKARVDENDDEYLLMRHWIDDCVANHGICHENYPAHCPTRLLDLVQLWSSGDVVLVERVEKSDGYIPYTALSHCWGSTTHGPVTTTLANLERRKQRIRFADLPLTFHDALTTTRKLKIPYLWIDSLCIIQDSPDDWEKEAAKMSAVYAGSVCTLSALGSPDSNGGFYRQTEKHTDFVYRHDLEMGSQRVRVFACEPNDWGLNGPLMDRAWTLQERELSNRLLHFSRNDLFWECKTLRATADLPWLQYRAYDSDPAPKLLHDSAEEASGKYANSSILRHRWFNIVQDYTQRKMTYGKDKLVAISGLAHDYHEREDRPGPSNIYYKGGYRGKYAAGLWEGDMPSALLWRVHQYPPNMTQAVNASPRHPPQRPADYRAPSWSWASVDGHVNYDSQKVHCEAEYGGIWRPNDPTDLRDLSEYDFGAFYVLGIETVTSVSDPMGAVSAGAIMLSGLVAKAIVDEGLYSIPQSGRPSTYTWLRDPNADVVGALLADVQTEVKTYDDVYCVSVRNEMEYAKVKMPGELAKVNYGRIGERSEMVMGLALTCVRSEEAVRVFRRLGLVRWVRKELWAGKEVETFKVI